MKDGIDGRTAGSDSAPVLDFERLDAYRVALEFQGLASSIVLPVRRRERIVQMLTRLCRPS